MKKKKEKMPDSASSPISQEILPPRDNNVTKIPNSTSHSPSPPASASTVTIDASSPITSPIANASSSNSTIQPNPSFAPPPLNNALSPPPSPAPSLQPNSPPSSPKQKPSEFHQVFSPPPPFPPKSSFNSPPDSKALSPPAAPVLSPPPTRESTNLSPPVQVVAPANFVTPSVPAPPGYLISDNNISPPKSSAADAPISVNDFQGNSFSSNESSSDTVQLASHVAPYNGIVIIASICGAVIALIAILFLVLIMRKRKKNGLKKQYRPTPNGSGKKTDDQLQKKTSNLGEIQFHLAGYDVSGSTLSPTESEKSHESSGGYGYHAETADTAGTRPCFTYEELMGITNAFSEQNKIGEGGFGPVFRGCLPDGRTVAVKQLKFGSGQGEREFKAEVEIISRIHHRHLVSLVGYCISKHHRLVVYEFVPNKTLEHHLHGKDQLPLDWQKRIKIALGSARGLVYLHEYCHPRIIHRDIKSANILLDNSFEAMVADFGLAKVANDTNTHVSTRVVGTFGYMAPEYAASGKLTEKSDVFSFGVVLLELISGRKPVDICRPQGEESLVEWARPLLVHAIESGDCEKLVDTKLGNNFPKAEMLRIIEVAASCVRHSAVKRPRMAQVLRALENNEDTSDISNGVKVGESVAYNSDQYSADIRRFRRMAFGTWEFSSGFVPSTE